MDNVQLSADFDQKNEKIETISFIHPEINILEKGKMRGNDIKEEQYQTHGFWYLQYFIFQDNWEIFVKIISIMWTWFGYILSSIFLFFSFILISYSILLRLTYFYQQVPGIVSYFLFLLFLGLLALLEGTLIAVVELMNQPLEYLNPESETYFITSLTREKI